jgi:hypothetical protein
MSKENSQRTFFGACLGYTRKVKGDVLQDIQRIRTSVDTEIEK